MYILIGGGGQVGYYLARELICQSHEELARDKCLERFAQLTLELGTIVKRRDVLQARMPDAVGCKRMQIW